MRFWEVNRCRLHSQRYHFRIQTKSFPEPSGAWRGAPPSSPPHKGPYWPMADLYQLKQCNMDFLEWSHPGAEDNLSGEYNNKMWMEWRSIIFQLRMSWQCNNQDHKGGKWQRFKIKAMQRAVMVVISRKKQRDIYTGYFEKSHMGRGTAPRNRTRGPLSLSDGPTNIIVKIDFKEGCS